MRRSDSVPARMHSSACGLRGRCSVDARMAAASSTTPADVTHECSWLIDRKKTSDGCDVCVSSTSANHDSQSSQMSSRASSRARKWWRSMSSIDDGGSPARVASRATSSSRRWNAL